MEHTDPTACPASLLRHVRDVRPTGWRTSSRGSARAGKYQCAAQGGLLLDEGGRVDPLTRPLHRRRARIQVRSPAAPSRRGPRHIFPWRPCRLTVPAPTSSDRTGHALLVSNVTGRASDECIGTHFVVGSKAIRSDVTIFPTCERRWCSRDRARVTGCTKSDSVVCSDGRICPEKSICIELFVTAVNTEQCAPDGWIRRVRETTHRAPAQARPNGSLLPDRRRRRRLPGGCGNGILDLGRGSRDDANSVAGDGCSDSCMSDETCGNASWTSRPARCATTAITRRLGV